MARRASSSKTGSLDSSFPYEAVLAFGVPVLEECSDSLTYGVIII